MNGLTWIILSRRRLLEATTCSDSRFGADRDAQFGMKGVGRCMPFQCFSNVPVVDTAFANILCDVACSLETPGLSVCSRIAIA